MNYLQSLRSSLRAPLQRRNFSSCSYDEFTSPFLTSLFASFLSSSIVGLLFTRTILSETNKSNLVIIDRLKKMEEKVKKG
jgi:hypothetical protein